MATDKEKLHRIGRRAVHYDRREYCADLTPAAALFLKDFATLRHAVNVDRRVSDGQSGLQTIYFVPKKGSDFEKMLLDRQKRK